jgi:pSer/pThr/pTyr-binding forkhead associated (FHA) protein
MMRFFTILEGEGKGTRKAFTEDLMIVGRSKNADLQIEDGLVSRRHLEIRVEGDTVFVENKSTHGSLLNGKPLVGVVSLNPGDVLDIGHTKLSYEEEAKEEAPKPKTTDPAEDDLSSEIDGTRIGDGGLALLKQKEKEPAADETRAVVEDRTRMMDEGELPKWTAQQKKEEAESSKGLSSLFLVAILLLGGGGFYWYRYMRPSTQEPANPTASFADRLYAFSLEYPSTWAKITDDTGVSVFGLGADGSEGWVRLSILTNKDPGNAVMGMTDGFRKYQKALKARYDGFGLKGLRVVRVNDATAIYYVFESPAVRGKGLYLLNAEANVVIECACATNAWNRYKDPFSDVLQSFRLDDPASQQTIDFPLPDDSMQHLALANPQELSREVDAHVVTGQTLLSSKDVKPDNLYLSVQEFRAALQLADAPPEPLPSYRAAAQQLVEATKLFNIALNRSRYEINRAQRNGDNDSAYWEAHKMMQMIPDKTDPAYQEAYEIVQSLQKPRE